jgi:hypothetical protein
MSSMRRPAVLVALVACSAGSPGRPDVASAPAVTFHKDVAPVLVRVCQNCHVAGGIAPFPLVRYDDARAMADAMVTQTSSRRMPPWGAHTTTECTPPLPWRDDLRLSDEEIAAIRAWHELGDPEGNPADAPPPRSTSGRPALEGARALVPAPYSLAGTRDAIQCFVLDPALTKTQWLNGTFFVPSNPTIVHHALAFAIPADAPLPTSDPSKPYECFGGPRVPGASLVAAWAPGSVPAAYPPDVGLELAPGTRFVMQVHYHPHANASRDPDATTFQFRVVDDVPTYRAVTRLVGNFTQAPGADPRFPAGIGLLPSEDDPPEGVAFAIPPNKKAHVETMQFDLPFGIPEVYLAGVGAHMHLAGKDEKLTLRRAADPSAEVCLLHEPAWNFDWQRGYAYDAPIESLPTVRGGDRIDIRCTYDNTMQNPKLAAALTEAGMREPRLITLGESTTDEMCLAGFVFFYRAPRF